MVRISKDPEIRRNELIEAAEELFREKGFEQTSVSDIVKNVGVAQGTFYYYFDSKDDILDAVLEHYLRKAEQAMKDLIVDDRLNAQQKLQLIIDMSFKREKGEKDFIKFLHSDENLLTHQKYMMKTYTTYTPLLTRIVEQGIQEGLFDTQYPGETVELLLMMIGHLHDSLVLSADNSEYYRKTRAAEDIIVKVLGIKKGYLKLAL